MCAHLHPDGSASWALRIYHNQIDVVCHRYTRWAQVWSQAWSIFAHVLDVLASEKQPTKVVSVGLKVVDQFVGPNDYDLNELFQPSVFIPAHVFAAGPRWQYTIGWFEKQNAITCNLSVETLLRTVVSGPGPEDRKDDLLIQISHARHTRLQRNDPELENWNVGAPSLESNVLSAMTDHHGANKTLLLELLRESMIRRVGLRGGV